METPLHPGAYAGDVAEFQRVQAMGKLVLLKDDQAVWLLQVAGNLGQQTVGRKTDGAAQGRAHIADLLFDFKRQGPGRGEVPLLA